MLLNADFAISHSHGETKAQAVTVEPRFNEPLFNEVLDITNDILSPGQSYSKMYGIEPRYNEPRYDEFFDITNIIRKPKRKNLPRYNELQCQHATDDHER